MNVTTGLTEVLKPNPASRRVERLASLGIPLAVVVLCFVVELQASPRLTSEAGRSALLSLLAGLFQVLVMVSIVPWWSAGLLDRNSFGTLIAALRVVTMTVSTTVLLLALAYLEGRGGYAGTLKVQVVVVGVGLLAAGLREPCGSSFEARPPRVLPPCCSAISRYRRLSGGTSWCRRRANRGSPGPWTLWSS